MIWNNVEQLRVHLRTQHTGPPPKGIVQKSTWLFIGSCTGRWHLRLQFSLQHSWPLQLNVIQQAQSVILTWLEVMPEMTKSSASICLNVFFITVDMLILVYICVHACISVWLVPHQCTLWVEVRLLTPENTEKTITHFSIISHSVMHYYCIWGHINTFVIFNWCFSSSS